MNLTSKLTRKELHRFLTQHASPHLTLNIGSGRTNHRPYFPHLINLDLSPSPSINIVADAHHLPFKDCTFSQILCTETLEHTLHPQQVINEIHRTLKKNGRLILTTRFIFPLHETPQDYYRFTKYGLRHLLRNWGQVIIQEEARTQTTLAILLQRLAYQSIIITKLPLFNLLFHLIAKTLATMPNIFRQEYGNIERKTLEHHLLASGYYLTAIKSQP